MSKHDGHGSDFAGKHKICQELSFMTMELFTSFCVGCGYCHWDKGHQYRMVTIIYMMSFIRFNIKMNLQQFIFSAPVVEEGWRICKCKLFFHSQPPAPNFSTFYRLFYCQIDWSSTPPICLTIVVVLASFLFPYFWLQNKSFYLMLFLKQSNFEGTRGHETNRFNQIDTNSGLTQSNNKTSETKEWRKRNARSKLRQNKRNITMVTSLVMRQYFWVNIQQ